MDLLPRSVAAQHRWMGLSFFIESLAHPFSPSMLVEYLGVAMVPISRLCLANDKAQLSLPKFQFGYLETGVLEFCRTAVIKLGIDRAFWIFSRTTTDKLEETNWSEVHRMFRSREVVIFRQRMMISLPPSPDPIWENIATRVNIFGLTLCTGFGVHHCCPLKYFQWKDKVILSLEMFCLVRLYESLPPATSKLL